MKAVKALDLGESTFDKTSKTSRNQKLKVICDKNCFVYSSKFIGIDDFLPANIATSNWEME